MVQSIEFHGASNDMSSRDYKIMKSFCIQIIHKSVMRLETVPHPPRICFVDTFWRNVKIKTGIYAWVGKNDNYAYEVRRKVSPY